MIKPYSKIQFYEKVKNTSNSIFRNRVSKSCDLLIDRTLYKNIASIAREPEISGSVDNLSQKTADRPYLSTYLNTKTKQSNTLNNIHQIVKYEKENVKEKSFKPFANERDLLGNLLPLSNSRLSSNKSKTNRFAKLNKIIKPRSSQFNNRENTTRSRNFGTSRSMGNLSGNTQQLQKVTLEPKKVLAKITDVEEQENSTDVASKKQMLFRNIVKGLNNFHIEKNTPRSESSRLTGSGRLPKVGGRKMSFGDSATRLKTTDVTINKESDSFYENIMKKYANPNKKRYDTPKSRTRTILKYNNDKSGDLDERSYSDYIKNDVDWYKWHIMSLPLQKPNHVNDNKNKFTHPKVQNTIKDDIEIKRLYLKRHEKFTTPYLTHNVMKYKKIKPRILCQKFNPVPTNNRYKRSDSALKLEKLRQTQKWEEANRKSFTWNNDSENSEDDNEIEGDAINSGLPPEMVKEKMKALIKKLNSEKAELYKFSLNFIDNEVIPYYQKLTKENYDTMKSKLAFVKELSAVKKDSTINV